MECLLLLWDELDDLLGVGRCLVARAVMRMNLPGVLLVSPRSLLQPR
jgi:hypothetical protein